MQKPALFYANKVCFRNSDISATLKQEIGLSLRINQFPRSLQFISIRNGIEIQLRGSMLKMDGFDLRVNDLVRNFSAHHIRHLQVHAHVIAPMAAQIKCGTISILQNRNGFIAIAGNIGYACSRMYRTILWKYVTVDSN